MNRPCCDDDKLAAFVDNEQQSEAERRQTASHILLCPGCAQEVGQMLAQKALTQRAAPERAPAGLWERVVDELDRVDGVARALHRLPEGRRSLVPALVAVGVLLILCAIAVRIVVLRPVPVPQQLMALHQQVLRTVGIYPGSAGGFQAVASTYGAPRISVAWQGIGRFGNSFAIHRLVMAGRLPVSVIVVPLSSVPLEQFERRVVNGQVRFVAQMPQGAVVVVPDQGMSYVLVAGTSVDDLLSLAGDLIAQVGPLR